mmetsp:Transcript_12460/g.25369  ORF Transcript_12460/g.25369 Transcript_12460/m.25369 type:complete len:80 (+) Transcript_12460:1015-1254(+)
MLIGQLSGALVRKTEVAILNWMPSLPSFAPELRELSEEEKPSSALGHIHCKIGLSMHARRRATNSIVAQAQEKLVKLVC